MSDYVLALLVSFGTAWAALGVEIECGEMRVRMEGGTVTSLVGRDGAVYAGAAAPGALGAIRRIDGELTPKGGHDTGTAAKLPIVLTYDEFIGSGQGRLEFALWEEEGSGDLVVEERATSDPGVHGVQWGIAGIPLESRVLVPGHSGLGLDRDAPGSEWVFSYPMTWEAQFVIVEGKGGGVWVWAEDARGEYKNLRVYKRKDCWELGFESQNLAPFEEKTAVRSVRWHLNVYRGDWRVPARRYREWAERSLGLTRVEAQQPAWVRDIRAMVLCGLELDVLDVLAEKLDPKQTMLYVPGWRRDGYDRNYPDYTAVPELGPFLEKAHDLGFRVMLHVNYFGCDPKNELYAEFEPYQVRDPFSKEKLWWTWERADPPIKFAYINPACKAWRELFVSRMRELCRQYPVDALHLDQTLCIWNHAGGLVDGMTMIEGNIAEHRELRAALPDVALSGEGLNEVTCRYEGFAQRHVWGINHADGTWYRPWLERAHPVASYVLRPFTIINGYLGMASPQNDQLYAAWRQAYVNWGVIPTMAWPSVSQLGAPESFSKQLLEEVRFFQETRADPDMDGPWGEETLFPYRTADGRSARYVAGRGFALVADGDPPRVIAETVTGVREVSGPGSIAGWLAYDDQRIFGLNPEAWYALDVETPRHLEAFHVSRLPGKMSLERVTHVAELAVIETSDPERVVAWVSELLAEGRTGFTVLGGEGREQEGPLSDEASGASFLPMGRELLTLHPPWRAQWRHPDTGALQGGGTGEVYALVRVPLPGVLPGESVWFLSEVHMDPGAVGEGKTDGVTYSVQVSGPGGTLQARVHTAEATPVPLNLDLTRFAGSEVSIRLSADPGPQRSPSFDWGRWRRARVEVNRKRAEEMEVVSREPFSLGLTAAGEAQVGALGQGRWGVRGLVPGAVYLLRAAPVPVEVPCDLTKVPFVPIYLSYSGVQLTDPQFASAAVQANRVGGVTKLGFFAHPPNQGRTILEFPIALPPGASAFRASVGLREGSMSEGCVFLVQVTGQEVARLRVVPGAWHELETDLSPWAGKAVVLSLITDAEGSFSYDWACWGEPRVQ